MPSPTPPEKKVKIIDWLEHALRANELPKNSESVAFYINNALKIIKDLK